MRTDLILTVFAAAVIIIILSSLSTFYQGIKPPKTLSDSTPADFGMKFESLKLETEDGLELDAWYVPAENKTNISVIILHGYPFDKGNVLGISAFLQEDFNLLFFDFRYLGRSQGKYTSLGYHERKDLEAAAEHLRSRGQEKIGAYGISMGAAVILLGAETGRIDAAVADSPYATLSNMLGHTYRVFGPLKHLFTASTSVLTKLILNININDISPADSVKKLDAPVLVIHSKKDSQVPVENAYQLKEANPDIELWILEGSGHISGMEISRDDYEKRIRKFFQENLR